MNHTPLFLFLTPLLLPFWLFAAWISRRQRVRCLIPQTHGWMVLPCFGVPSRTWWAALRNPVNVNQSGLRRQRKSPPPSTWLVLPPRWRSGKLVWTWQLQLLVKNSELPAASACCLWTHFGSTSLTCWPFDCLVLLYDFMFLKVFICFLWPAADGSGSNRTHWERK